MQKGGQMLADIHLESLHTLSTTSPSQDGTITLAAPVTKKVYSATLYRFHRVCEPKNVSLKKHRCKPDKYRFSEYLHPILLQCSQQCGS